MAGDAEELPTHFLPCMTTGRWKIASRIRHPSVRHRNTIWHGVYVLALSLPFIILRPFHDAMHLGCRLAADPPARHDRATRAFGLRASVFIAPGKHHELLLRGGTAAMKGVGKRKPSALPKPGTLNICRAAADDKEPPLRIIDDLLRCLLMAGGSSARRLVTGIHLTA